VLACLGRAIDPAISLDTVHRLEFVFKHNVSETESVSLIRSEGGKGRSQEQPCPRWARVAVPENADLGGTDMADGTGRRL
jgi:hypothetical protein